MSPRRRVQDAGRRWTRDDFNRPTLLVARDLLGKYLVRSAGGRLQAVMLTEVEAYKGPRDLASHARGGRRTPRVEPLYAEGGTVYVYFIYGMHWMLNFSTAGEGKPEAILVRGAVLEEDERTTQLVGPARVTRHLDIDKQLDGADATSSPHIWVEDRGERDRSMRLRRGPRVGIDYSGPYWASRPWRFWLESRERSRISGP